MRVEGQQELMNTGPETKTFSVIGHPKDRVKITGGITDHVAWFLSCTVSEGSTCGSILLSGPYVCGPGTEITVLGMVKGDLILESDRSGTIGWLDLTIKGEFQADVTFSDKMAFGKPRDGKLAVKLNADNTGHFSLTLLGDFNIDGDCSIKINGPTKEEIVFEHPKGVKINVKKNEFDSQGNRTIVLERRC